MLSTLSQLPLGDAIPRSVTGKLPSGGINNSALVISFLCGRFGPGSGLVSFIEFGLGGFPKRNPGPSESAGVSRLSKIGIAITGGGKLGEVDSILSRTLLVMGEMS